VSDFMNHLFPQLARFTQKQKEQVGQLVRAGMAPAQAVRAIEITGEAGEHEMHGLLMVARLEGGDHE